MKALIKRIALKLYRCVWGGFMDEYSRALESAVTPDCQTLLDIGCGAYSPLSSVAKRMKYSVGVDAHLPALEVSRIAQVHTEHVHANALELQEHFDANSFDCVAATDLIEHLERADGLKLLDAMEKIARKKVVVFTPNGFLPQSSYDGNDFQEHRSGWSVQEMQQRGYHVIGVNGWKPLRGERALIRLRPRFLWEPISFISQPFVRKRPERAFQLLCVKTLVEKD